MQGLNGPAGSWQGLLVGSGGPRIARSAGAGAHGVDDAICERLVELAVVQVVAGKTARRPTKSLSKFGIRQQSGDVFG